MSLEKAVRNVLINDSDVSGDVSARVYPQRRPTGTALPCIVYQLVFQEITQSLATQSGIQRSRLSVEILASTYASMKTLVKNVEDALITYTGTVESEVIKSTRLESTADIDEVNDPSSQFGTYRTIMDFIIWHQPE